MINLGNYKYEGSPLKDVIEMGRELRFFLKSDPVRANMKNVIGIDFDFTEKGDKIVLSATFSSVYTQNQGEDTYNADFKSQEKAYNGKKLLDLILDTTYSSMDSSSEGRIRSGAELFSLAFAENTGEFLGYWDSRVGDVLKDRGDQEAKYGLLSIRTLMAKVASEMLRYGAYEQDIADEAKKDFTQNVAKYNSGYKEFEGFKAHAARFIKRNIEESIGIIKLDQSKSLEYLSNSDLLKRYELKNEILKLVTKVIAVRNEEEVDKKDLDFLWKFINEGLLSKDKLEGVSFRDIVGSEVHRSLFYNPKIFATKSLISEAYHDMTEDLVLSNQRAAAMTKEDYNYYFIVRDILDFLTALKSIDENTGGLDASDQRTRSLKALDTLKSRLTDKGLSLLRPTKEEKAEAEEIQKIVQDINLSNQTTATAMSGRKGRGVGPLRRAVAPSPKSEFGGHSAASLPQTSRFGGDGGSLPSFGGASPSSVPEHASEQRPAAARVDSASKDMSQLGFAATSGPQLVSSVSSSVERVPSVQVHEPLFTEASPRFSQPYPSVFVPLQQQSPYEHNSISYGTSSSQFSAYQGASQDLHDERSSAEPLEATLNRLRSASSQQQPPQGSFSNGGGLPTQDLALRASAVSNEALSLGFARGAQHSSVQSLLQDAPVFALSLTPFAAVPSVSPQPINRGAPLLPDTTKERVGQS